MRGAAEDTEFALGGADSPEEAQATPASRDRDLLGGSRSKIRSYLDDLFDDIARGWEDQAERSDDQVDYWNCYNCEIDGNQYYNGIASVYFPIIRDAINAIVTRHINQLFPQSGRYVEVIAADGSSPSSMVALLEYYIRSAQFETQVARPMICNGCVEGQFNLYVDWSEISRWIVSRETHGPIDPETGDEMPGEDIEDINEEEVIEGAPVFEVLHDCDVLVLPATADSIKEALKAGGAVVVHRRWTRAKIDQMVAVGVIRKDEAKALKAAMTEYAKGDRDIEKTLAEHVGIYAKGKAASVWEVWHMLPLDERGGYSEDGKPRLCRIFFGPDRAHLGAKRNPYWNDLCPLLSAPVEKQSGVFKGASLVKPVSSLQYEANDAVNEGADAATLSAAPIILRDPAKSSGPLVFGMGAIWEGEKDAISLMTFPDLTPRAVTRVQMALAAIFQSLGVNPSMLPQQTTSEKSQTQAEIAQNQAVDLLTTSQGVKVPVECILTPACGLVIDYDYQFRDKEITVRAFGDLGIQAELEQVAPLQNRRGFAFVWRGGEQVKQTAMMQQQGTAWVNVLRGLRAELAAEGYQLHLGPLIEAGTQSVFGSPLGSKVLIDQRHQLTIPPDTEDGLMLDGHEMPVHPLDNDQEHLQEHAMAMRDGDPHGTLRVHIAAHIQSMQMKTQASMQRAQAQQGMPPDGGAPGAPGQPQPGAQPGQPHAVKRPPGAVHPDQASGAGIVQMPRRN